MREARRPGELAARLLDRGQCVALRLGRLDQAIALRQVRLEVDPALAIGGLEPAPVFAGASEGPREDGEPLLRRGDAIAGGADLDGHARLGPQPCRAGTQLL